MKGERRTSIGTMAMAALALTLAVPGAVAQQSDQQAAQRRELERKMQQMEQQMRDLERELARLSPGVRVRVSADSIYSLFRNHAYLGVTLKADKNPATDSTGALLTAITPGGPADQAGLKAGDIVTAFNGEKLTGHYAAAGEDESEPGVKLRDLAGDLDDGDTVKVDYRRGKETRHATIVARDLSTGAWGFAFTMPMPRVRVEAGSRLDALRPEAEARAMMPALAGMGMYDRWFGMELVAVNPELGEYFGTSEGLLVIHAPDDSTLSLRGGDVILAVDGRRPTSQTQLVRILRSYAPGETVHLDIMRQKRRMTVTATIPERGPRRDGFDWDPHQDGVIR